MIVLDGPLPDPFLLLVAFVCFCIYFSAETYSTLGLGDLFPTGPIRLLAGAEALNGLVLVGWSASFAYIAMERFWRVDSGESPS